MLFVSAPAQAAELVVNGGFESGGFGASWVHGAYQARDYDPAYADHLVLLEQPYSDNYSPLLGFKYTRPRRYAAGFMYCDVTIPANISDAIALHCLPCHLVLADCPVLL